MNAYRFWVPSTQAFEVETGETFCIRAKPMFRAGKFPMEERPMMMFTRPNRR